MSETDVRTGIKAYVGVAEYNAAMRKIETLQRQVTYLRHGLREDYHAIVKPKFLSRLYEGFPFQHAFEAQPGILLAPCPICAEGVSFE